MTQAEEARTLFRVYAFCEGAWRAPAWMYAVDLTAHRVEPRRLRANIVQALMEAPTAA